MIDVTLPALPMEWVAAVVLAFFAGAAVPAYYAQERLRGFGRVAIDRLPYKPPPGMKEEQAMSAALESAEEVEDIEERARSQS